MLKVNKERERESIFISNDISNESKRDIGAQMGKWNSSIPVFCVFENSALCTA